MHVLIAEPDPDLGALWARHVERRGARATLVASKACACAVLRTDEVGALVLDLALPGGTALAVADYARLRRPAAGVILVSAAPAFADGSVFRHLPNARAHVGTGVAPEDLAEMALHWGDRGDAP